MVRHGKKEEGLIRLITTVVTSKDGHVISVTIQPLDEKSWFAALAGPNHADIEWGRIFWGPESIQGDDAQSLKDHVEKRVQEIGAKWKGWNHHTQEELPGTGRMN